VSGWSVSDRISDIPAFRLSVSDVKHSATLYLIVRDTPQLANITFSPGLSTPSDIDGLLKRVRFSVDTYT